MKNFKIPKLTVVGAGPGDVELITLKAIKALGSADVVLYDALVNEELLQYAANAKVVFVGKRLGCHAYTQDQINEMIVAMANRYGHVVRLKGGDPFIFGRGSEELEYVEKFGLETAVVPGISSALGVPASVGISLTQRKIAESFWVITGTTSNHQLSKDIHLASKSTATVVILMGMHMLNKIISIYKENRKGNLPIAIIQNGTKNSEHRVIGTTDSICKLVADKKISSPAIIVIGEVVKNISKLTSYFHEHFEDEFIFQNLNLES